VRRSVRHEQREEDHGKGDHALAREEGLPVKGFTPHNEVHASSEAEALQVGMIGGGMVARHGRFYRRDIRSVVKYVG
jgi:hypothetical protein